MTKQRECVWRREIKKTRGTETPEEEKRRKEKIRSIHLDIRQKREELREKRRKFRECLNEQEKKKVALLAESRKARVLEKKKKKNNKRH